MNQERMAFNFLTWHFERGKCQQRIRPWFITNPFDVSYLDEIESLLCRSNKFEFLKA